MPKPTTCHARARPDAPRLAFIRGAWHALLLLLLLASVARAGDVLDVRGRVVDHHGQPLAGARVLVVPDHEVLVAAGQEPVLWDTIDHGLGSWPAPFLDGVDVDALQEVRTDDAGRFEVPVALHDGPLAPGLVGDRMGLHAPVLVVAKAGFTRRTLRAEPREPSAAADVGDIALEPEAIVRGRVVDADGAPREGVRVRVVQEWPEPRWVERHGPALALPSLDEVRTDAMGAFELHGAWAGHVSLRVAREDLGHVFVEDVALAAGEVTEVSPIELTDAGRLVGRVLDAEGRPLAGAELLAVDRERSMYGLGCVVGDIEEGDDDVPWGLLERFEEDHARARTGADGTFVLRGVRVPATTLFVRAPGHEPARLRDVPRDGPALDVRLLAEATLDVTVADASTGQVLTDARVSALRACSARAEEGLQAESTVPVPVSPRADGTSRVHGPGRLRTILIASAPGHVTGRLVADGLAPGRHGEVRLELQPAGVLSGRIVAPDGQPASFAEVRAVPDGVRDSYNDAIEVRADKQGRFGFDGLTAGGYRLIARLDGCGPAALDGLGVAPGTPVDVGDLVLPRAATLVARHVDVRGASLGPVSMTLRSAEPADRVAELLVRYTMSSGKAAGPGVLEFGGLAPGTYVVAGAGGAVSEPVDLAAGERVSVDVVPADATCRVRGRVTSGGRPLQGVQLSATVRDAAGRPRFSGRAETDADGAYAVGLREGESATIRVEVTAGARRFPAIGTASRAFEYAIAPLDRDVIEFDIPLPTGELAGLLVDEESGDPVPGLSLGLSSGDQWLEGVTTDEDGRFAFPLLSAGDYVVRSDTTIWAERLPIERRTVTLAEGERLGDVRLVSSRGASLAGRVTLPGGGPSSDAVHVCLRPEDSPGWMRWVSVSQGRYEKAGLRAGTYRAWATRAPDRAVDPEDMPVPDEAVTIVLGDRERATLDVVVVD